LKRAFLRHDRDLGSREVPNATTRQLRRQSTNIRGTLDKARRCAERWPRINDERIQFDHSISTSEHFPSPLWKGRSLRPAGRRFEPFLVPDLPNAARPFLQVIKALSPGTWILSHSTKKQPQRVSHGSESPTIHSPLFSAGFSTRFGHVVEEIGALIKTIHFGILCVTAQAIRRFEKCLRVQLDVCNNCFSVFVGNIDVIILSRIDSQGLRQGQTLRAELVQLRLFHSVTRMEFVNRPSKSGAIYRIDGTGPSPLVRKYYTKQLQTWSALLISIDQIAHLPQWSFLPPNLLHYF
jgi:hypothetical protein